MPTLTLDPEDAALLAEALALAQEEAGAGALEPSRPLRLSQQTPNGDWRTWLILAGRGWGKTLTGAEDVKRYGLEHPGARIAIVARSYADARDTCVEGESGLLSCLPPHVVSIWNRSLGELILTNGTRYKLFSADQPDRLRGPQHHRAWCDELAAWGEGTKERDWPAAYDMLMFGLRLGDDPRCVVTTTPRPTKLIRSLMERRQDGTVAVTRGTTAENAANLAPAFLDAPAADLVVAETHNGGDLVIANLRTVAPKLSVRKVTASRGKQIRAQPVSSLYEQGRISHVDTFPELEDQLTTWTPESGTSPDRLDALVWALTELMVQPAPAGGFW
jgi:phage terminase large subunit-like protein